MYVQILRMYTCFNTITVHPPADAGDTQTLHTEKAPGPRVAPATFWFCRKTSGDTQSVSVLIIQLACLGSDHFSSRLNHHLLISTESNCNKTLQQLSYDRNKSNLSWENHWPRTIFLKKTTLFYSPLKSNKYTYIWFQTLMTWKQPLDWTKPTSFHNRQVKQILI